MTGVLQPVTVVLCMNHRNSVQVATIRKSISVTNVKRCRIWLSWIGAYSINGSYILTTKKLNRYMKNNNNNNVFGIKIGMNSTIYMYMCTMSI